MSTERDDTTPVPAQPGGTSGDQPTTPIPRPGTGRTEEPTLVFDTFVPEPDTRAARPIRPTGRGAGTRADTAAGTRADTAAPTEALPTGATGSPDATRPLPAAQDAADRTGGHTTARTSAFAEAGVGTGSPGTTGAGASPVGVGASSVRAGAPPLGSAPGASDTGTSSTTSSAVDLGAAPAADPSSANPGISRQLRVGTVVWGLVVAIIGAGIIAVAAGATFDLELALIGLLALAGLALVVGSVVTARRRR